MHDKLAFTTGFLLESHQLIEAIQLGLQTVRVAFTAGILLESHQLTEAVQLGYKPSEISTLLPYLQIYIIEYIITSHFTLFQLPLQLRIKA